MTIGKALLFPSVIEALGDRGDGLTSEVWWSPNHPFNSSLTGISAGDLADGYSAATGRPWTQPIGFKHALFEVVADVIGRAEDLEDADAIASAIAGTNIVTIVGRVNWSNGPIPTSRRRRWSRGSGRRRATVLTWIVANNAHAPEIPLAASCSCSAEGTVSALLVGFSG